MQRPQSFAGDETNDQRMDECLVTGWDASNFFWLGHHEPHAAAGSRSRLEAEKVTAIEASVEFVRRYG